MRGTTALAPGACSLPPGAMRSTWRFSIYGHAQLLKLQVWADEAPEDFQLDGETV